MAAKERGNTMFLRRDKNDGYKLPYHYQKKFDAMRERLELLEKKNAELMEENATFKIAAMEGDLDFDALGYELSNDFKRKLSSSRFSDIKGRLRAATPGDYIAFLRLRTKPATHFYDYDMPAEGFYVATADVHLPPMCGAQSVNVIAPVGVKVTHMGGTTHNNIFDMSDPDRGWFVPSYLNACV